MLLHQFYQQYANTPLNKRGIPIDAGKYGLLTLDGLYANIKAHDEAMRPARLEEERLLKIADDFFYLQ